MNSIEQRLATALRVAICSCILSHNHNISIDPQSPILAVVLDLVVNGQSTYLEQSKMDPLAAKFHEAMIETYHRAKTDCGYKATYFLQMVSEIGGVETARRLLASASPATGLIELWRCRRLDLSVEAQVLRPEFAPLFSEEERAVAQARLAEYGYKE